MKVSKRWAAVTAACALLMFGGAGIAIAQATSNTPTKAEALAAIQSARDDLDIAQRYIESQEDAPPQGIQVTAQVLNDNQVKINWTVPVGVTGWTVNRDGVDRNGTGPWTSAVLPPETNTFTFNSLLAATEYTFTVSPQPAGTPGSVKATTQGTVTPPPTTTPTPPPTGGGGTAASNNNWGNPTWEYNFDNLNGWGLYNDPGNQHGVRKPGQCVAVNGILELRSLPDRSTCGMADNLHKNIEYGRWETRVKSTGAGWMSLHIIWPSSDVWPRDGERDWREHRAGANCFTGFIHYPGHTPQTQYQLPENAASCVDTKQWHNVAYEVTPTRMKGWVDGVLWYDKACDADLCQMPGGGHLTIQNDDQGNGGGNTATTFVDWVKYYKLP